MMVARKSIFAPTLKGEIDFGFEEFASVLRSPWVPKAFGRGKRRTEKKWSSTKSKS
jgi:hypothetical protein